MKLIADIFKNKPYGWGLRGDPYFWLELAQAFAGKINDLKFAEFDTLLDKKFDEIIKDGGKTLPDGRILFEKFPKSGISGGFVSAAWWKETGLPLLKKRYRELGK